MKKSLLATAATLACGAVMSNAAYAADWSDTSLSWRYGPDFTEPGNPSDIRKNIVALTHVSGYKYGSNFFNVDVLTSDKKDPANNSTNGAQEIYLVYQTQLHLSKISSVKPAMGPIADYALSAGFDFNAKNDAFAPRVRKFMIGPTVKFGGEWGWADLSLLYYKEKNHNGIVGVAVDFDPTWRVGGAWGVKFSAGPVPLSFNGFFAVTGEKGKDGFGNETNTETLVNMFLMTDISTYAGAPGKVWIGPGYEYWKNKFGSSPDLPGSKTSTAMIKMEYHF